MAIQHLPESLPHAVTVWIPNEREGQILGGTATHSSAAGHCCASLLNHAGREGLPWLVRQETQILYQRAVYARPQDRIGSLYPDCLVALGVEVDDELPYDLTKVAVPPVLVIEIVSKKTARKDVTTKVQAYAEMGIQEYVIFDPRPRKKLALTGYRLATPGHYVPILPAAEGCLWLASVALRVVGEAAQAEHGPRLRFITRLGTPLLHADEEAARADEEAARADEEAARADEEAARADEEAARADEEAAARLRAEQVAEEERGHRRHAEQEIVVERERRAQAERDRDAALARLAALEAARGDGDEPLV